MDHSGMDHSQMGHAGMDHSGMDHSGMDHSNMDHSNMDHSNMDHSGHAGHDMAGAVVSTTVKAIVDAVKHSGDHSGHDMGDMTTMDMGHGGMDMDMDMSMSFHFGYEETILFEFWKISTIGGLIGSMIGIFIMAMLYEGLKYWREHLFRKAIASMQYCANVHKNQNTEENKQTQYMEQIIMPPTMNMLSTDHAIQTGLHMFQMIVSYFLMLIFMTYNVWLCLACVLGAGLGYFLFGWRKSVVVDITEHCH